MPPARLVRTVAARGPDLSHVANIAKHSLDLADWLAVNAPAAWAGYLQSTGR